MPELLLQGVDRAARAHPRDGAEAEGTLPGGWIGGKDMICVETFISNIHTKLNDGAQLLENKGFGSNQLHLPKMWAEEASRRIRTTSHRFTSFRSTMLKMPPKDELQKTTIQVGPAGYLPPLRETWTPPNAYDNSLQQGPDEKVCLSPKSNRTSRIKHLVQLAQGFRFKNTLTKCNKCVCVQGANPPRIEREKWRKETDSNSFSCSWLHYCNFTFVLLQLATLLHYYTTQLLNYKYNYNNGVLFHA